MLKADLVCESHAAFSVYPIATRPQPLTTLKLFCRTREPNSERENCVVMWAKENYRWADWRCQVVNDETVKRGGSVRFRPLCQKDSHDHDLNDNYSGGMQYVAQEIKGNLATAELMA